MAADTGVTEPKGHEESHRDGENTARVKEDNQKRGQLLWVAFASLSCSLAPSFCLSSTPGSVFLYLHCLCFLFLTFSLSLSLSPARSTALLASGNAVRSPLSLCDGGMACGVKGAMKR